MGVTQGLSPRLRLSQRCPGAAGVMGTSPARAFPSAGHLGGFSHCPGLPSSSILCSLWFPALDAVGAQQEPSCCWSGWHRSGWSQVLSLCRGEGELSFSPCLTTSEESPEHSQLLFPSMPPWRILWDLVALCKQSLPGGWEGSGAPQIPATPCLKSWGGAHHLWRVKVLLKGTCIR